MFKKFTTLTQKVIIILRNRFLNTFQSRPRAPLYNYLRVSTYHENNSGRFFGKVFNSAATSCSAVLPFFARLCSCVMAMRHRIHRIWFMNSCGSMEFQLSARLPAWLLDPYDFYLLPKYKVSLKWSCLQIRDEIMQKSTMELNIMSKKNLPECFQQWKQLRLWKGRRRLLCRGLRP